MWSRSPARWRDCVVPLLVTLLVGGPGGVQAHPHALVVYSIVLSLPPGGVDRIGFVFTFDPLFSAIILRNTDGDDPGHVLRNHERSLRQLPFEIEIAFNGLPVALEPPTDLQVSTEGGEVTYRFAVPLRGRLLPPGTIDIGVDDPGMFAAFALRAAAPVEIHASGPFAALCGRAQTATGAPGPVRCQYVETRETADVT
jgi:ABC-type uncharacterized transport system substrate-binding protein